MEIPQAARRATAEYIEKHRNVDVKDKEPEFEHIFGLISKYHEIGPNTKVLEIGPGTGWLQIICALRGIPAVGIEVNPLLVEFASEYAARYGVEPDIRLGSIEDTDIGQAEYDIVIAASVFEHVEHWKHGLQRVYEALKPGGLLYFGSTNKFSRRSGEYSFPFYGWMPNFFRYWLRRKRDGPDIMLAGIDFHQFTYPQLRRFFRRLGFSKVYDRLDMLDPERLQKPTPWKKACLRLCKRFAPLKLVALCPLNTTDFICVK